MRRTGRVWRSLVEWSERNPGVAVYGLPNESWRWNYHSEKLHRSQVIAWLWEHLDSVVIPAEFAEEFRPLGISGQPSEKQVRASFCQLAEIAMRDHPQAEELSIVSLHLMIVAAALGLKDEAAEAATIFNAHNQANMAEIALRDKIGSVLRQSGDT